MRSDPGDPGDPGTRLRGLRARARLGADAGLRRRPRDALGAGHRRARARHPARAVERHRRLRPLLPAAGTQQARRRAGHRAAAAAAALNEERRRAALLLRQPLRLRVGGAPGRVGDALRGGSRRRARVERARPPAAARSLRGLLFVRLLFVRRRRADGRHAVRREARRATRFARPKRRLVFSALLRRRRLRVVAQLLDAVGVAQRVERVLARAARRRDVGDHHRS